MERSRYARANNADDNNAAAQDFPQHSFAPGYYFAAAGSAQVYYAAARGHLGTLCKLLTEGANPDWYNPEDGLTPLQIAALKGRAACVHRLLVAGADIFATGAQGCTALDLFIEHAALFRFCDRVFWYRNYKRCIAYLQKAHADCQRRLHETTDYPGLVVIHPDDELGLACVGVWSDVSSASREYPACIPAGPPVYQSVQPDSPASNQPEYAMLLPSPPLPPTRPGEPAAAGEAAVDTARSPRGQRPTSPQHARFRSASTGPGLRSHPSKARPHSRLHTPTDAAAMATAPRATGGRCCGGRSGGGGAFGGGSGQPLQWPLRDGVQSAPTQRPPIAPVRHAAWMLPMGASVILA